MRNLLVLAILAVLVSFAFTQSSFAACGGGPTVFTCDTTPPNPDPTGVQQEGNNADLTVNVLPGAGIDRAGDNESCISTGDGADDINVDNGDINCGLEQGSNNGIHTRDGDDTIDVTNSEIQARDAIRTDEGNDTINVLRSMFTIADDCADTGSGDDIVNFTDVMCRRNLEGFELGLGNDTVNILRSEILCIDITLCQEAIEASIGDDTVTVVESVLRTREGIEDTIDLSSGNDTIALGTGADIGGLIDCGSGFDTIIFTMDVPEEAVGAISSQILQAGLPDGSITINGLFYEWVSCELLVPRLNGVRVTRPIPTLSEWGLISMAGVLGIGGLLALRKRAKVSV